MADWQFVTNFVEQWYRKYLSRQKQVFQARIESLCGIDAIYKRFRPAILEEIENRERVEEIIDFLEMEHIRKRNVGQLSYGLRKRVELGRALALEPKLLLLDEPMAGMNVEEKEDMARFILDIHEQGDTTVVLIEHDIGLVMDIADHIVVLDFGQKIGEGTPDEIRTNQRVIDAYLGDQA